MAGSRSARGRTVASGEARARDEKSQVLRMPDEAAQTVRHEALLLSCAVHLMPLRKEQAYSRKQQHVADHH